MSDLETLQAEASQFKDDFQRILQEVHKVIVGQERVVECAVTALLAGGNVRWVTCWISNSAASSSRPI
jgi:MoxR-like ATPase